jgi:hypothetical protein
MNKSSAQVNAPLPIFFFVLQEAIRAFLGRVQASVHGSQDDGSSRMW